MSFSSSAPPQTSPTYDSDFYGWTQAQAVYLRNQDWNRLDISNLVEEIEALGKQQQQELRNRLSILIGHLLKWQYQPQKRSRSWQSTIQIQRIDITDLLDDNPSLKPYITEAIAKAYRKAIMLAGNETQLSTDTFPAQCPYNWSALTDEQFYPGDAETERAPI